MQIVIKHLIPQDERSYSHRIPIEWKGCRTSWEPAPRTRQQNRDGVVQAMPGNLD